MVIPSSACSGAATSLAETAIRGGCKDQGMEERSRGPVGSIACSAYKKIWPPFRARREEAQRDRTVPSQFVFSSPLPLPKLGSALKFLLPMALPGCETPHRSREKSRHQASDTSLPQSNQAETLPLHTQISKIQVLLDTGSLPKPAVQREWRLCIFLILHQPSGAEASPTLPAPAEGLIHQA